MTETQRAARPLGLGGVGDRIKLVAVDADDTLWDCQGWFQGAERELCALLSKYVPEEEVARELAEVERRNVPLTGYGATAFTLSMVEAAVRVSRGRVSGVEIERILELGRRLMELPAEPLPGVEATLRRLRRDGRWTVVAYTKGEPLAQEAKLRRSGLREWLDEVAVVGDKTVEEARRLCRRFGVREDELLMVGDSFRSDIDPVLRCGGWAAHVPHTSLWAHEAAPEYDHERLWRLRSLSELL